MQEDLVYFKSEMRDTRELSLEEQRGVLAPVQALKQAKNRQLFQVVRVRQSHDC